VPDPSFSFPGVGEPGPPNVGVALFSFSSVEAYDRYRREVASDPQCVAATERLDESKCFSSYERSFLKPILPR